ncbi:MAG: hypothetical protein WA705_02635 [Candidatus Ozemobacteraceae bacterium]
MKMLFVSPVPFHGLRQRHQALAVGFVEAGQVVEFLDPPQSGGLSCRVVSHGEHLRIWQARLPFRAAEWPSLQKIASRILFGLLRKAGLEAPSKILFWTGDPSFSALAAFPWRSRIYDRCDRHGAFPGQDVRAWTRQEKVLYEYCDVVFASTGALVEEALQEGARKAVLLPNAADISWIQAPRHGVRRPPPPPVRVISAGAHFEWVDMEWLRLFAQDQRCELHIAGPGRGSAFHALVNHSRVRWHGTLSHEDLRALCDECHVGLVPFHRTRLTEAVDPVKAYEYAARGLNVWVSGIPHLQSHLAIDRLISNQEDLEQAIQGLSWPLPKRDHAIPVWQDRVNTIFSCEEVQSGCIRKKFQENVSG